MLVKFHKNLSSVAWILLNLKINLSRIKIFTIVVLYISCLSISLVSLQHILLRVYIIPQIYSTCSVRYIPDYFILFIVVGFNNLNKTFIAV